MPDRQATEGPPADRTSVRQRYFARYWLASMVGDSVAHVISAILLSAAVAAVTCGSHDWLHPHTANEALLIGDERVLLTFGFEVLSARC
jgi:hypothetical protein